MDWITIGYGASIGVSVLGIASFIALMVKLFTKTVCVCSCCNPSK